MDEPQNFGTKMAAFEWLKQNGFKLSRAKFYKDVKAGRLVLEPDGTVRRSAVKKYIVVAGLQRPAEMTVAAAAKADKKTEAEIRQLNLRNEKLSFELDRERKKYILKEDADRRLVQTSLAFFACLRSRFFTDAVDLIAKVGGNADKANLLRKLLERLLDDALHEAFAEGEIQVEVREDEI